MRWLFRLPVMLAIAAGAAAHDRAAPPIIMVSDCFPGPWIVFFDRDAATLDVEDIAILRKALGLKQGACGSGWSFGLIAHADRGERAGVDRRRVQAVRRFLRHNGLGRAPIRVTLMGTRQPRVAAQAGAGAENQRVELIPVSSEQAVGAIPGGGRGHAGVERVARRP